MASRFWVGGAGTWDGSTTTHWATTTGGTGGASAPTSSDTATFDTSSGLSSATVTVSATAACSSVTVSATGATLQQSGNFLTSGAFLISGTSTWDANGFNVTAKSVQLTNVAATVKLGASSTWTVTGTGTVWSIGGSATITTSGSSLIAITDTSATAKTFSGGSGKVYDNIAVTGGGAGTLTFSGTNTFLTATLGTPKSYIMTAGQTITATKWVCWGASLNLGTFTSSTPGSQYTLKQTSGYVWFDWVSLTDCATTGGASFYAGADSTSVSNNSGWTFTHYPLGGPTGNTAAAVASVTAGMVPYFSGTANGVAVATGAMARYLFGTSNGVSGASSTLRYTLNHPIMWALEADGAYDIDAVLGSSPPPAPYATVIASVVKEYPPLRLGINVSAPDGSKAYWSQQSMSTLTSHQALTITTTVPGGFEHADMTLNRDPRRSWPDLQELETLTVHDSGGNVAWEGRLETIPSVTGDQLNMTPGAVGWQSSLTDYNAARELYIDCALTTWQGSPLNRKVQLEDPLLNLDTDDGSVVGDPSGVPAMDLQLTGSWAREHTVEAWYDSLGLPLGALLFAWEIANPNTIGDITPALGSIFTWAAFLSNTQTPQFADAGVTWDSTGNLNTSTGLTAQGTLVAGALDRVYAFVSMVAATAGGNSGVNYDVYWPLLQPVGTQNLPLYPSVDTLAIQRFPNGPSPITYANYQVLGVLASDVLGHCVPKYAPRLATTWEGQSTITPSSFVIPQVLFEDAGTLADMVKAVTAYELLDWFVWEGPTFWCYPRGAFGRKWRGRVGPCQLNQTGDQIDQMWNGVVVSFTDVTGVQRTVGPPGTNCTYTDPGLVLTDPSNPMNQLGIQRYAQLEADAVPLPNTAIQLGKIFLEEQNTLDTSGSAQLSGFVEDDHGVIWPAFAVRAGDLISFTDAADTTYHRIVQTSYNDDTKVNSITLDSPPDTLDAILARLQVSLAPITGGIG